MYNVYKMYRVYKFIFKKKNKKATVTMKHKYFDIVETADPK